MTKKKVFPWASVIIGVVLVAIVALVGIAAYLDHKEKGKRGFEIEVVVPDQIIVIKSVCGKGNPTNDFVNGMREASKNYIIGEKTPINEDSGLGSRTAAIILFVEPKQK